MTPAGTSTSRFGIRRWAPSGYLLPAVPGTNRHTFYTQRREQCPVRVQGIALDLTGNIYTANDAVFGCDAEDRVNVYPSGSNGDIAPIAIIEGNSTGLQNPRGIAIGPVAP